MFIIVHIKHGSPDYQTLITKVLGYTVAVLKFLSIASSLPQTVIFNFIIFKYKFRQISAAYLFILIIKYISGVLGNYNLSLFSVTIYLLLKFEENFKILKKLFTGF